MGWVSKMGAVTQPMTHRQLLVYDAISREDWNRLDKLIYYVMQLTAEVARGRVKDPKKIKIDDFKITFKAKGEEKKGLSAEERKERAARAKAEITGRNPLPPQIVRIDNAVSDGT